MHNLMGKLFYHKNFEYFHKQMAKISKVILVLKKHAIIS
jgi:hypothetical protein